MSYAFRYPVYVWVESSSLDASGFTTFTQPLAIACTSTGENPITVEAIPVFTEDAHSEAFRQIIKAPHTRRLRLLNHDHLIDFLSKSASRAKYLAMDPTTTLHSDRLWSIEEMVTELRKYVTQRRGA